MKIKINQKAREARIKEHVDNIISKAKKEAELGYDTVSYEANISSSMFFEIKTIVEEKTDYTLNLPNTHTDGIFFIFIEE